MGVSEWRFADRPTIQMRPPYVFLAEEPVYITQLDAFGHYRPTPLPRTIFGGRFPIHAWPRPLMWAMECHDTSQDLVLTQGNRCIASSSRARIQPGPWHSWRPSARRNPTPTTRRSWGW